MTERAEGLHAFVILLKHNLLHAAFPWNFVNEGHRGPFFKSKKASLTHLGVMVWKVLSSKSAVFWFMENLYLERKYYVLSSGGEFLILSLSSLSKRLRYWCHLHGFHKHRNCILFSYLVK